MSFGFPAYHLELHPLADPAGDIAGGIAAVFRVLGWPVQRQQDWSWSATINAGLRSWGEVVHVSVLDGQLRIESRCRLFTQCLDWGKNAANVRKFVETASNRGLI
ncbi:MAG: hypothetical protein AB7K09_00895 [Planctomycetota bacterium]